MVLNCFIQKKYLHVCRSSQICTGIILLELSSEGLFILLKKIFCCWRTLICTTIQQCSGESPIWCMKIDHWSLVTLKFTCTYWIESCINMVNQLYYLWWILIIIWSASHLKLNKNRARSFFFIIPLWTLTITSRGSPIGGTCFYLFFYLTTWLHKICLKKRKNKKTWILLHSEN